MSAPRRPGLWIVFDGPPGPVSGQFVEVEDENGRSVGLAGREWRREEGHIWALGPFAPIHPRGHRAVRLGRLVLTTTMQGLGAPIIDPCSGTDLGTGDSYRGRAILLKPWKRGERSIRARALVVGWIR